MSELKIDNPAQRLLDLLEEGMRCTGNSGHCHLFFFQAVI